MTAVTDRSPAGPPEPGRAQSVDLGSEPGPATRRRDPTTMLVALAVAVALLGPLVFLLVNGWRSAGSDQDAVRDRRRGVQYLRPLTELAAALTDAWVSTAAGQAADPRAVRAAVTATDAVDTRQGDELGLHDGWTDLRQRVLAAVPPAGGSAGPDDAAELVDRTVRLIGDVGTASGLALDPEPDGRYLADAAVSRLPALVAAGGRLAALVAGSRASDEVLAVAADRVGHTARELDESLSSGASAAAGTVAVPAELAGGAGAVRLAADEMAPSAPMLGPPTALPAAAPMAAAQRRLQAATLPLSTAVLDELDSTLSSREAALGRRRLAVSGVAGIGLLAACGLLWVRLPAGAVVGPVEEELTPVVRGPAADDAPEAARLIDARALLREVEVVRIGRAVRSAHRRPGPGE